jgi:hypothetical protein
MSKVDFSVENYGTHPASYNLRIMDINFSQNLKKTFTSALKILKSRRIKIVPNECPQFLDYSSTLQPIVLCFETNICLFSVLSIVTFR